MFLKAAGTYKNALFVGSHHFMWKPPSVMFFGCINTGNQPKCGQPHKEKKKKCGYTEEWVFSWGTHTRSWWRDLSLLVAGCILDISLFGGVVLEHRS